MKKNKDFSKPEAYVIKFRTEDVIVTSDKDWWDGGNDVGGGSGEDVPNS